MSALPFPSKYHSSCKACGGLIEIGEPIAWLTLQGSTKRIVHAKCSPEAVAGRARVEASRATSAERTLPKPYGLDYAPYQEAGIVYALQAKNALIADEMGLGKTIQGIGFLNASPEVKSVCVVTPASLKINWTREIQKWCTRARVIFKEEKGIFSFSSELFSVDILNYDILKRAPERSYDVLLVDEAQMIVNPKAKRSQAVKALRRRCKHVLLLTGTPLMNRPLDLWHLLQLVNPEEWDPPGFVKVKNKETGTKERRKVGAGEGAGFFDFAIKYCGAHKVVHGKEGASHWDFSGASNLDALQERLRATCMVRRLKADVLAHLPPKRRQMIYLPEEWKGPTYDDLVLPSEYDAALAELRADKLCHKGEPLIFSEITRTRHDEGMQKVKGGVEFIRLCLDSTEKVIVFAHHRDVIEATWLYLKEDFGAVFAHGDVSMADRQKAVDTFQNDSQCRVIVAGIVSMGTGHTLTRASVEVFLERDWVPSNNLQAEDRAHRIGQREMVQIYQIVNRGSIDARMTELLVKKLDVAERALDRREDGRREDGR